MTIVPAVIPKSSVHLRETLRLFSSFATETQVDVTDGVFVSDASWPYVPGEEIDTLSEYTASLDIEVDLMVDAPERVLETYLRTGIARAVVHLESVRDLPSIIALKRDHQFLLGFSISNDTPLDTLESVIGYADYVQLMGIAAIGSQGQPFDERVLDRIRAITEKHAATLPISIDGSVNADTLPLLAEAGADRAVVGSAILNASDPRAAYERLVERAIR